MLSDYCVDLAGSAPASPGRKPPAEPAGEVGAGVLPTRETYVGIWPDDQDALPAAEGLGKAEGLPPVAGYRGDSVCLHCPTPRREPIPPGRIWCRRRRRIGEQQREA